MPDTNSRLPTDAAERLALGKKLHEKHWPSINDAAAALGVKPFRLYPIQKEYRDSAGIVTAHMLNGAQSRPPAKTMDKEGERRAEIKRRSYEKRKAEKLAEKLNGASNGQLVRVPAGQDVAQFQNRIVQLERDNAELAAELAHAMDENQTLQKLLMVVGRTL